VKITRNGKTLESKSFPKLAETKQWSYRLEVNKDNIIEINEETFKIELNKEKIHKPTLHDLIVRYTQDILPEKKPTTIPSQKAQLKWWDSQLGDYTLTDITPKVLTTYKALLIEKTSSPTAKRYLTVLSHAFTIAI
jgi:hypothetical protein